MSYESSKQSAVLPGSAHSDHSVSVLIDRLCDEFEKSWKSGHPITIEQQLNKVSPGNRSALFRELLEIEVELRTARNEKFHVNEYLQRFPQETELTDLVFRKTVRRRKLGDYELLDEIGHGGMGIVYRARQVFLGQTVAVKVLSQHYHSDPHVVSRFRREMRMIGGLHHPNIVQALNAGESGGTLYLAMEYVDGYNLHSLIKNTGERKKLRTTNEERRKEDAVNSDFRDCSDVESQSALFRSLSTSFPVGAAAEVIRQAAVGLEHACEQGLVHRDIKPANLMITKNGVLKILDLGLGKFRAENRLNESLEPMLTQFGATMGTIDYMAPEQWENAVDVDIRADIYGLGCTLFFMLTGIAPLDASGPTSQRKKLLARLEGTIPDIEKFRPDCPPELAKILRKMIAKEPADRFQTPGELFHAIMPLADLNALKSVIATAPVVFESGAESAKESKAAYRTSDEDTIHGDDWSAVHSKQSRGITGTNPPLYPVSLEYLVRTKPFRASSSLFWHGYKPGLLILLCALLSFFLFRGFNRPTTGPLSVDPVDPVAGSMTDRSFSDSKPKPENELENQGLEDAVCDLVQLPGLGGQWWFVEMPWYLPFVREAVPGALRQTQSESVSASLDHYANSNIVRARESLQELTDVLSKNFPSHRKALIEGLYHAFDKRLDKEGIVQVQRNLLAGYEAAILALPETGRTASDYHAIALMRHSIAQQASDRTFIENTKESYKTALQKYAQAAKQGTSEGTSEESQIARQLEMVCRSDFARFAFWADDDFAAFAKEADAILDLKNVKQSDLFVIEFLTTYGDYSIAAGRNNDSLFKRAREILDRSKIEASDHPLEAHINERFAWSLIDQCEFRQAAEQFSEARLLRRNNFNRTRNAFEEIYIFHNDHGLAICQRYLGDTEGAKTQFAGVVQKVKAALERPDFVEPAQQRYFSSLNERLSNTLERYGDCVLYGGAASFGTAYSRVSPAEMRLAAELYEESRNTAVSRAVWYVMSCKAAMIKLMGDDLEGAREILDELEEQAPRIAFGSDQRRARTMRQVADFVDQWKQGEQENNPEKIADGLALLRRFVDSETSNESRYRREPLELQLFCVEVLITSKLKAGDINAARQEAQTLESLLSQFASLGNTRPFFYPFYDLAIHCFAESEQDRSDSAAKERAIRNQLKYIRQSRLWQPKKTPVSGEGDAAVTGEPGTFFFYFSPQGGRIGIAQGGIAIFVPADNAIPMERFSIPYPRREVKEAAGSGSLLALPTLLADRINAERAAGRDPEISFGDRSCWYQQSEALQDTNWPFDVPINAPM